MSTKTSSDNRGLEFDNKSHYDCEPSKLSVETWDEYQEYLSEFDWGEAAQIQHGNDITRIHFTGPASDKIETMVHTDGIEVIYVNFDYSNYLVEVIAKFCDSLSDSSNSYDYSCFERVDYDGFLIS